MSFANVGVWVVTLSPLWTTVTSCSFWLPNKLSRPPLHISTMVMCDVIIPECAVVSTQVNNRGGFHLSSILQCTILHQGLIPGGQDRVYELFLMLY